MSVSFLINCVESLCMDRSCGMGTTDFGNDMAVVASDVLWLSSSVAMMDIWRLSCQRFMCAVYGAV